MKLTTSHVSVPVEGDADDFWLVQRLSANTDPSSTAVGLDRSFRLDFMGASEYEWGTPNRSLKAIRALGFAEIRPVEITRGAETRTVYFVGSATSFDQAIASFGAWFKAACLSNKEVSYFDSAFERTTKAHQEDVVAWWAFDANVFFTLQKSVAKDLLAVI